MGAISLAEKTPETFLSKYYTAISGLGNLFTEGFEITWKFRLRCAQYDVSLSAMRRYDE